MEIIKRFSPPTKLDKADFGSVSEVTDESGKTTYYIQIGSNEPEWWEIGTFFTHLFKEAILSGDLIYELLLVFQGKLSIFQWLEATGDDLKNLLS